MTSGLGCGYQGYEFGSSSYPDSLCIDGILHDADADLENREDIPCPSCNIGAWLAWRIDLCEDDWDDGISPAMSWEWAVLYAIARDEAQAMAGLALIGRPVFGDWEDRGLAKSTTGYFEIRERQWPWDLAGLSAHQKFRIEDLARKAPTG